MDTGHHMEPTGEEWGERLEEWGRLQALLDLARQAHRTELSPERRAEIRERVLERIEKNERRRRRVRAFLTVASALTLAGVLLTLALRPKH